MSETEQKKLGFDLKFTLSTFIEGEDKTKISLLLVDVVPYGETIEPIMHIRVNESTEAACLSMENVDQLIEDLCEIRAFVKKLDSAI